MYTTVYFYTGLVQLIRMLKTKRKKGCTHGSSIMAPEGFRHVHNGIFLHRPGSAYKDAIDKKGCKHDSYFTAREGL
jgi:hypothetical protein